MARVTSKSEWLTSCVWSQAGKYNWQAFGGGECDHSQCSKHGLCSNMLALITSGLLPGDGTGPGIDKEGCSAYMEKFCAAGMQVRPATSYSCNPHGESLLQL